MPHYNILLLCNKVISFVFMKHCHFSIFYNELPLLKQKLPFLYKHFKQIILYDLSAITFENSNDGSSEFIKNFPDPQKKIKYITKKSLNDINRYNGSGSIIKRKMFAYASQFVHKDIDVFWCTDMDEFFNDSLIKSVETHFRQNEELETINVPHHIFYKSTDIVFTSKEKDHIIFSSLIRIARHQEGNIYGHCPVLKGKNITLQDERIYHFSYVGWFRVLFKLYFYSQSNRKNINAYKNYLKNIFTRNIDFSKNPGLKKKCHPNNTLDYSITQFKGELPKYIDLDTMMKELYTVTDQVKNVAAKMGVNVSELKVPQKIKLA